VVLAAIVGTTVASARAAVPWTEPVTVGPPADQTAGAAITFARDGSALLSWRVPGAPGASSLGVAWRYRLAIRTPAGVIVPRRGVPEDLVLPVADEAGWALLRQRTLPFDRRRSAFRVALGVSLIGADGKQAPLQTLARFVPFSAGQGEENAARPAVAADGRGDVAVAWVESVQPDPRRPGSYRLRVALRAPGHRSFAAPQTVLVLGPHGRFPEIRNPVLAYGPGGELLVSYVARRLVGGRWTRVLEARVRRPSSGAFSGAQILGSDLRSYTDLQAAVAPTGRMVVAWGTQRVGEGVLDHFVVRAAVRRAGARRFAGTQLLDPGPTLTAGGSQRIALALAGDGTATVAWSGMPADAPPTSEPAPNVRVASTDALGRFVAFAEIAPGVFGDLSVRVDGTTLVTWTAFGPPAVAQAGLGEGSSRQRLAALRAPGADAFGPAEAMSAPEAWGSLSDGYDPDSAFNPRNGEPTVVWPAAAGNGAGARAPTSAVLRLVVRTN
jgi:hypothetical protein